MDENMSSSPPKIERRRSSFFDRRQSVALPVVEMETAYSIENGKQEALEKYMEKLTNEKTAWKQFYPEKKKELDDNLKCLKTGAIEKITLENLYDMMGEEEKDFMKMKPDYKEVWRDCSEACTRAKDLLSMVTRLASGGYRSQDFLND